MKYNGYDHYGMYGRGGNKWLDQQFSSAIRAAHVEAIREGVDFTRSRNCVFGKFVCPKCSADVQREWPERARLRRERWERERIEEKKAAEVYAFTHTWRHPKPGEFNVVSGKREFKARSLDHRPVRLVFSWRTCLTQECRGHVPAQRVGLWANGHLAAHYYGWDLRNQSDLFGPGLAFWIEKTFQRDLVRVAPAAIWRAKSRLVSNRRSEDGWDGLHTLHICNYGQGQEYPDACVIHTVWPNGSVYAQLRNFYLLQQVVEFAWEAIHVDIREMH